MMTSIQSIVESSVERLGLSRLDEISKETKKAYIDAALDNLETIGNNRGALQVAAFDPKNKSKEIQMRQAAEDMEKRANKRKKGINRAISKLGEAADDESSNLLVSRGFVTPHVAKKLADASTFVQRDKSTNESHYFHPKHGHFVLVPHKSGQYQLRTKKEPSELLKEDTLTELSPQTLGSYIKNADIDRAAHSALAGSERSIASMAGEVGKPDEHYMAKSNKAQSRSEKRFHGILRATDKLVGKAHRPADLRESVRAHGIPQYLYNLGNELGSDLGFHKESRMINPKTNSKDYVFHVDRLSDAAKARIKKDYPEAVLGLSSGSQFAPEHKNPIIVIPGRSRRKDIINEVSRETLSRYINKAKSNLSNAKDELEFNRQKSRALASVAPDEADEHRQMADENSVQIAKRSKGIHTASKKLAEAAPSDVAQALKDLKLDRRFHDSNGQSLHHTDHDFYGNGTEVLTHSHDDKTGQHLVMLRKETPIGTKRVFGSGVDAVSALRDVMHKYGDSMTEAESLLERDTLNELSKETLGRYITKAAKDISLRSYLAGNHEPGREKIEVTLKHIDKSHKHTKGIEKAVKKLTEAAPPDMEDWVKENKAKFVEQYGDKKGHEILYATAWKMHNKKMNEDVLNEVSIGQVVKLRNGKHFQVSGFKMDKGTKLTNVPRVGIAPEPGSKVTHYIGTLGNSRSDAERNHSRTEVPVGDIIKVIRGD